MSEGLLKKRIQEHVTDDSFFDGEDDVPVYNHAAVDKILDAAKKDLQEPIARMEKEGSTSMDYVYTYQILVDRIKKWFGSDDK